VACTAPPQYPDLEADWPLVRAALAQAGLDTEAVVWSDPAADWASFDLVVANGVWDYIHHVDAFVRWTEHVGDHLAVPLVNAPETLRWNLDKHYLDDLEAAGVAVVPTTFVEPGDDPAELALPGAELVIKPAVSGGGFSTARYEVHQHEAARAHLAALTSSGRTAMVQPYQSAVDREGETGLIFLGGTFSHAVHKEPMIRRGAGPRQDLVEHQAVTAAVPTAAQLELGRRALGAAEAFGDPPVYARVDVVHADDGAPLVLELELLDPVLFFRTHPEGATAFARVLADRLEV
jgi:glutathione synthase/RimK-type ligase-like ATP-grasp enzyme